MPTATIESEHQAGWRLEPTLLEIKHEQARVGATWNQARELVSDRLAADSRRLSAIDLGAVKEINSAFSAADEANRKASELLQRRTDLLSDLESKIHALGEVRWQIRWIQDLVLDENGESEIATRAMDFYLANQGNGTSPQNRTGFANALEKLATLTALRPHIPAYNQKLESKVAALVAEIRETARRENVDLSKVLSLLKTEVGNGKGTALRGDLSLYTGLLE